MLKYSNVGSVGNQKQTVFMFLWLVIQLKLLVELHENGEETIFWVFRVTFLHLFQVAHANTCLDACRKCGIRTSHYWEGSQSVADLHWGLWFSRLCPPSAWSATSCGWTASSCWHHWGEWGCGRFCFFFSYWWQWHLLTDHPSITSHTSELE